MKNWIAPVTLIVFQFHFLFTFYFPCLKRIKKKQSEETGFLDFHAQKPYRHTSIKGALY